MTFPTEFSAVWISPLTRYRGPGSNGTVNALKTWLEFANPLRWWGLANFDLLNEFIVPIFGRLMPSLVPAKVVS